jgi:hypothetical protein
VQPVVEGRTGPVRSWLNPVSWPWTPLYPYDTFEDWAEQLTSSDDANLDLLALPKSAVIKQLAKKGEVTAAYVYGRRPADVAALLRDPSIASFTPGAVRFDLSEPR